MEKTILVTGGAGYIGSTVTKNLHERGYRTIVLDNLSTGYRDLVYKSLFYEGDLLDKAFVQKVFQENQIHAVMHFAAFSSVGESMSHPQKYFENNLIASLNLFSSMLEAGVKKLVFSSTAAVYGVPESVPIQEEAPCRPVNPYGFSKLAIEEILKSYFDAYDLASVSLRYFNACGTEKGLDVGELHQPETHLIPLAMRAALEEGKKLKVFGTDYETEDGTCVRDYIHVSDLADAHIKALELLFESPGLHRLNLSNDKGFSVLEIIKAVEKLTGKKMTLLYGSRREGDPPVLIGVSKQARERLSWKPKYTSIEKAIETTKAWQESKLYKNICLESNKEKNGAGKGARTLDLRDGNATL